MIMLLGAGGCALGSPTEGFGSFTTRLCAGLGALAFALAVLAVVTGSLTPLSLLVGDVVALWLVTTVRHVRQAPRRPLLA